MSLPACQQRALHAMESALEASEPRLKAMFAMFARLTKGEQLGGAESLPRTRKPRWRSNTTIFLLFPVAASVALVVALVIGLIMSSTTACGGASSGSASRASLGCSAQVSRPLPALHK
jgi:hypothetical protein